MPLKPVLQYKLKGERNNRPRRLLVQGDFLYVLFVYDKRGFTESRLQCLDIHDFGLRWEYTHTHVMNNLELARDGSLLASCMGGEVHAFDARTGALRWTFQAPDGNIGAISAEADGAVVVSGLARNQRTWCLEAATGTVRWQVPNTGHSYHPFVHGGIVLNAIANDLHCLELKSGKVLWRAHEPATYLFNPKVVGGLAVAPGHGLINFYELETGRLAGTLRTGRPTDSRLGSIREVLADDTLLYFGDAGGTFYCFSLPRPGAPPALQWKAETGGAIESFPAFYGEAVLVINDGCQFLAFDRRSGTLLQEGKTKGASGISGVTAGDGAVYYSCGGGHVCKCMG